MLKSEELWQKKKEIERKKDELVYQQQEIKQMIQEHESILTQTQNLGQYLASSFKGSRYISEASANYADISANSRAALQEMMRMREEVKRECQKCEQAISDHYFEYQRAIRKEEENG